MKNSLIPNMVSVVMTTYNRGHMIVASIDSLLNQTYKNLEIIIVDNASTDDTPRILDRYRTAEYKDRIRIFRLEENRRFAGGANFGMEQIKGEWFTLLDDDDLAVPEAIEKMMTIPRSINPSINAVTCNCIDTSTNEFSGTGLSESQYLPLSKILQKCKGEFWGITKTDLIRESRFNERILGYENTFWYAISARATRYYLHEGLRIYTTDHGPSLTTLQVKKDLNLRANTYRELLQEDHYWHCLQTYTPHTYRSKCFKGLIYLLLDDDRMNARKYFNKLAGHSKTDRALGFVTMSLPNTILHAMYSLMF